MELQRKYAFLLKKYRELLAEIDHLEKKCEALESQIDKNKKDAV